MHVSYNCSMTLKQIRCITKGHVHINTHGILVKPCCNEHGSCVIISDTEIKSMGFREQCNCRCDKFSTELLNLKLSKIWKAFDHVIKNIQFKLFFYSIPCIIYLYFFRSKLVVISRKFDIHENLNLKKIKTRKKYYLGDTYHKLFLSVMHSAD